jgi:hypothetical protein
LLGAVAWYYYHRTTNTLSWLGFLPLAVALASWRPRLLRAGAWTFACLNVALAAALQMGVRPAMAREFVSLPPPYVEALLWLDQNTPADSVVVTGAWTSDYLIRGYTHNLTSAGVDWWTVISPAARRQRIMVRLAVYGTPPATLARLVAEREEATAEFKANVNQRWIGGEAMDILAERQASWTIDPRDYRVYSSMSLPALLATYQMDYIWVGPWERMTGETDFAERAETSLVFQNSLIQIYQVND